MFVEFQIASYGTKVSINTERIKAVYDYGTYSSINLGDLVINVSGTYQEVMDKINPQPEIEEEV